MGEPVSLTNECIDVVRHRDLVACTYGRLVTMFERAASADMLSRPEATHRKVL